MNKLSRFFLKSNRLISSKFKFPIKSIKFCFSDLKNEKIELDQTDSHDDFKPKIKSQITENENINETIEKMIKENKVVLFMKGVPQHPMCGYSNFVVEVLKYYKIKEYKSVDILKDPIMREAVKKYSNWPTYPQLYIDGKLIGGCDIVNEMHKEGSLKTLLTQSGLTS